MPSQTKTRKRSGPVHHKHTKPYLKVYFPYLPLFILVAVGVFTLFGSLNGNKAVLGSNTSVTSSSLLAATNQQRAASKEQALSEDPIVTIAAQNKANDMVRRNYWSHNTPDNRTPWSFLDEVNYKYQAAGENLAYGFNTGEQTVAGWMNSAHHRENILNNTYSKVGFGIVTSNDYQGTGPVTVVVALYTTPATATTGVLSDKVTIPSESTQHISKVQTLTNGATPWVGSALLIIAVLLLVFMVGRRNKKLMKKLLKTERVILAHPLVDITIVAAIAVVILLSQTAGLVR